MVTSWWVVQRPVWRHGAEPSGVPPKVFTGPTSRPEGDEKRCICWTNEASKQRLSPLWMTEESPGATRRRLRAGLLWTAVMSGHSGPVSPAAVARDSGPPGTRHLTVTASRSGSGWERHADIPNDCERAAGARCCTLLSLDDEVASAVSGRRRSVGTMPRHRDRIRFNIGSRRLRLWDTWLEFWVFSLLLFALVVYLLKAIWKLKPFANGLAPFRPLACTERKVDSWVSAAFSTWEIRGRRYHVCRYYVCTPAVVCLGASYAMVYRTAFYLDFQVLPSHLSPVYPFPAFVRRLANPIPHRTLPGPPGPVQSTPHGDVKWPPSRVIASTHSRVPGQITILITSILRVAVGDTPVLCRLPQERGRFGPAPARRTAAPFGPTGAGRDRFGPPDHRVDAEAVIPLMVIWRREITANRYVYCRFSTAASRNSGNTALWMGGAGEGERYLLLVIGMSYRIGTLIWIGSICIMHGDGCIRKAALSDS